MLYSKRPTVHPTDERDNEPVRVRASSSWMPSGEDPSLWTSQGFKPRSFQPGDKRPRQPLDYHALLAAIASAPETLHAGFCGAVSILKAIPLDSSETD